MKRVRTSEAGFTLVELLVALAIFSLLSLAGVMLLRSGSDTQLAVKDRLDELSRGNRLHNNIEGDLAQAMSRSVRDPAGASVPAFVEESGDVPGMLFGFVRAGWSNLDEAPRPALQRVAYVLDKNSLKRLSWPMLDGAAPSDATVIVDNVASAQVRFRDDRGEWRNDWTAVDADALPRAVELRVAIAGKSEQRMLFLVGPQNRIKPTETDEGLDG